jgi:predicted metalloendopeptidase
MPICQPAPLLRTLVAILCVTAAGPLLAAPADEVAAPRRSGLETSSIDPQVRPQDDFFRSVNNGWLRTHEIPADRAGWGGFSELDERTRGRLKEILEATVQDPDKRPGSEAQKIADLYTSFLDEGRLDALGLKPLAAEFARVDAVTDKRMVAALLGHFNRTLIEAPIEPVVHQDARDASIYVVDVQQAGLGLPDRDYYLKDDDQRLKDVRAKYAAHVEKMLALAGDPRPADSARDIVALETALARVQWTKVQNRDPVKTYNRLTLAQLRELAPGIDWQAWMRGFGIEGKADALVVGQPSYLAGLSSLLQETSLDTWKTYLRWHLLSSYSPLLSAPFAKEHFAFYSTVLRGVPQEEPRWKRGLRLVDQNMGEALGKLYVARHFPAADKARAD